MKKAKKIVFILFLCILVSFPLMIFVINNSIAVHTMNDVRRVPLPEKTEFIEKISTAGKFTGNGNGMQYLGAILIKSELSEEKLKNHYSSYSENDRIYTVESQNDKRIKQAENYTLSFKTDMNGDNYFIVYSYGSSGNDLADSILDLDIRGH
ncbi:MAG: hypothetical protein K6C13_12290 [Oscillospiraceae bacterium]|nr:hypothetical protein [Oscillospiraceae bacterium]